MSLLVITSFSLGVIAQEDDSDVEEVVVTGSKIKSADLYSFAPVTEVTAEDIAISGKASIGEILAELPSQGSGLSRTFNNGGEGSVRIDMRNLGSGRTLILVDGKRWVNSGRGANASVDLNSIRVPPLKSIPKFKPLKIKKNNDITTRETERMLNLL